MALQKSKTLKSGLSGNYWKIVGEHYCRMSRVMTWHIALYKDRDASIGGLSHLGLVKPFSKALTYAESAGNRTEIGYLHIIEVADDEVILPGGGTTLRDPDLAGAESV